MIEAVAAVFGILVGAAGWYYGHRAHRSSVRAPILKLAFCHPNTLRSLPTPRDPRQPIFIQASAVDYVRRKQETDEGQRVGFYLPFIIRNSGTRTARQIRIHARYSPAFAVGTNGRKVEDADRSNWLVVEHDIPDLHPQQGYTHNGDFLVPDERLVDGFKVKVPVKFRDDVSGTVTTQVHISAFIEMAAFADDLEPTFRRAEVAFEREEEKDA